MGIKPGDKVRIIDDDSTAKSLFIHRIGEEAVVLATDAPGSACIKLQDRQGIVFYSRPGWVRKLNEANTKRETKAVKKQAAILTEKRMKEIKDNMETKEIKKVPTFQDFMIKARACILALDRYPDDEVLEMAKLAEKQLFQEMKDGCVWEDSE